MTWTAEAFIQFYELLTLPTGDPARLEGFQRLIIQAIFKNGRVELLVLIPKGHAKTTLMAALAVFHVLVTKNANCYVGAADKIQADELYRFAAHFVDSEPELSARLKVLRGTREIRSLVDQGFIRVLASDDSKQGGKRQGFNPTLALLDELHAHENDNLYLDMRSGLFKRNGLLVVISTAGWDLEGVLGVLRQSFLEADQNGGSIRRRLLVDELGELVEDIDRGRLTFAEKGSGRSAMLEWALTQDDDFEDLEVVKLANPASWVTIESLEDARESLPPWTFKRYRCNLWTLGFESWLPEAAWGALADADLQLDPDLPVVAALDMGRYRDCAALVAVQLRDELPAAVKSWIWRPGGPDDPVPYDTVYAAIRDLHQSYRLTAVAIDGKYLDEMYETLTGEGLPMEMFPQSNERMCPAAAGLRQAILDGRLAHDGDPVLAAHVMAPVVKEVGESMFKLTKSRRSGPHIDGCEALSMAWAIAQVEPAVVSAEWW